MPNLDINKAVTLNINITFDAHTLAIDPSRCVIFRVEDAFGSIIHKGNDFSPVRDEEMAAIRHSLSVVLENVIKPEIDKRYIHERNIVREIEILASPQTK
jgi:hypothetical protein